MKLAFLMLVALLWGLAMAFMPNTAFKQNTGAATGGPGRGCCWFGGSNPMRH